MDERQSILRQLPSVNDILNSEEIQPVLRDYPRAVVVRAIREAVDEVRREVLAGKEGFTNQDIHHRIGERLRHLTQKSLRRVINATGVVIHTNLGRAPIPVKALVNIVEVAGGYCNLEFDLQKGTRGKRYTHVRDILRELTGAEDALVVNNNASAVLLCLSALARQREVVVSRGELVEIGGAFRIPDVMRQSGAILKEVGTTNKTRLRDYEEAITENTALLLKVHRSNFRIVGFTEEVSVRELVSLGRQRGIPVMFDLGSGSLVDLQKYGIRGEPVVGEVIEEGVDIVTFSGDKLLGGPQAGIILGRGHLIEEISKHPLTRAVRIDKLTLAALESVLHLYRDEETALQEIPVLRMLLEPEEEIRKRARRLLKTIRTLHPEVEVSIVKESSQAGGGSLPGVDLPTYVVSLRVKGLGAEVLEEKLRDTTPPVLCRVKEDRLLFDLRTVSSGDIPILTTVLKEAILGLV